MTSTDNHILSLEAFLKPEMEETDLNTVRGAQKIQVFLHLTDLL